MNQDEREVNESELRAEIARALRRESSLQELYKWLMSRSWNMHKDSMPSAVDLAESVEALFFQRSDGQLSDAQVFAALRLLLAEAQTQE